MGIQPSLWGPYLWTALHLICEGAPLALDDAHRQHYRAFFEHLAHVLPCEKCSGHMQQLLAAKPLGNDVMTRQHLVDWCIDLHNAVSSDIAKDGGATHPPMDLAEARKHWSAVAAGKKAPFPAVCNHCGGLAGEGGTGGARGASMRTVAIFVVVAAVAAAGVYFASARARSFGKKK